MPSPSTLAADAQPHDSSLQPHQPSASSFQNGVNGEGAVQQPDAPRNVDGPDTALDESSAIREGKQKAKAVLAASGVNLSSGATDASKSRTDMNSPAAEGVNGNGASPSRKRSRSGSRKPSQTPAQDISEDEQQRPRNSLIKQIVTRDLLDNVALDDRQTQSEETMSYLGKHSQFYRNEIAKFRNHDPGAVFGYGYMGYGNGFTDSVRPPNPPHWVLQYPIQSKRPGNRRARRLNIKKKEVIAQAEQIEELVPIRLDIELDKIKLRDTFTWNLHDRYTTPELFAENLVEDFQIPMEVRDHVRQLIIREVHEQIQDFYPHVYLDDEPLDPHLPYSAYKNDEMRILIKLNITIGQHTLVDQFEWEMNNPFNSPEEFARQMAADMSLSGEFTTAIAHSIREQCQMFTKSLYITGHPFDGRLVDDTDIRDNFLPSPLPSVFRPMQTAKDFMPFLYELSEAELERTELSIMREQRRQKRSVNRRGGPALPDLKDRQRTVLTLLVSSVLPGTAETVEDSHLFKASRKPREGRRRGVDDDSDESDSEESAPESPAPSQLTGGTARTRGMRGAATAAQAAMRSAIGRSATPEVATLQTHHETRTSRQMRYEAREESVPEPTTLIVKLRISPTKFKEYLRNPKAFTKPASTPIMAPTPPPARSTPGANSMPPPPSPAMQPRSAPATGTASVEASPRAPSTPTPASQSQKQWNYHADGRADAPWPMPPGAQQAAPPPPWLQNALKELRDKNPGELFEATMRYSVIDQKTHQAVKLDSLSASASLPAGYKAQYLPRIRCIDCPGKLYNAGPDHSVDNFQLHLNNRQHRANVEKRTGKSNS